MATDPNGNDRNGTGLWFGTDPEALIITKTGTIRNPNEIIQEENSGIHEGRTSAVGVDGSRSTSSVEFRPGKARTAEELVNRLADLITALRNHYHPPAIRYIAGAWYAPEPLGGHVHISWEKAEELSDTLWRIGETITGLSTAHAYLVNHLFDSKSLSRRLQYVVEHNRKDFAYPDSIRPEHLPQAVIDKHFEYRYPPSWLMTPEAAYCFLGSAELITNLVFSNPIGVRTDWEKLTMSMFKNGELSPDHAHSLTDTFRIAVKFKRPNDFTDNWVA